jgi:ribose transport system ATP-binding protein
LGRERDPETGKVNWKKRRGDAAAVLEGLGAEIDPSEVVKRLSVAKRQLVEIAKAISLEASVIIMDEPTSSLTLKETENLFATIRNLKEKGVTIIYISHRLEEIFSISNRISVLRDGKYLGTYETETVTTQEIVSLIAGRELIDVLSKERTGMGVEDEDRRAALEVRNLSRGDTVKDVSFSLYENEILGIYGLQGAGRTELLETIFGLASATEGEIYVFGERLGEKKPEQMIRRGVAMVPEDRRGAGIFPKMDVTENINMSNTESMKTSLGILKFKAMKETAGDYKQKLGIKAHLKNQILRNLSGGNQQKVVIAKWLATRPRILLVDELTRGIDVGAKAEIFKILQELRDEGLSILFVSSELPEIISESDRVLVMRNGQKTAVLSGEEITKEQIIHYALQG